MKSESVDTSNFWPEDVGRGVVGINVSPLVARGFCGNLRREIVGFAKNLIAEYGYSVLFVPHVIPHGGGDRSDHFFMEPIVEELHGFRSRVSLAPSTLNAPQLKYVLGKLSYFIGARTHATIGAISSGVPTVSIAYSAKAFGINRSVFGCCDMVLDIKDLSSESLAEKFQWVVENEADLRDRIGARVPEMISTARAGFSVLRSVIEG